MRILFAPLQGYTEAAYRNAHAEIFGGVDTYYTPFVRVERGEIRRRDARDADPGNNRTPHLVPQLIASNAEKAEAIIDLFVQKGHTEVDINLGCPFPMLAKRHNGSGMLPFTNEVTKLLEVVNRHPELSFSVKMRLGWEHPAECLALAPILNELPLKQVALHARLGKQQYSGEVDLEGFRAFANVCRHPLVYNGDLTTSAHIDNIRAQFPTLNGVMIGRGLLMNPALAWEYRAGKAMSSDEMRDRLLQMHRLVYADYERQLQGGEAQLLTKMKCFWEYLEPQIGHKAWKTIRKSTSLAKYRGGLNFSTNL